MNILIVAATDKELELIQQSESVKNSGTTKCFTTGVGTVASTFALAEITSTQPIDLIIQVGIAGSFSNDLVLGTAVAVEKEVVADMGVIEPEGYKNIFELGLAKSDLFPFYNGALVNPHSEVLKMTNLKTVAGSTVNEITTQGSKISLFKEKYHVEIESMEGAALHYVCIMKNIPFIQIRGISNVVGERDKSKWKINEAINSATNTCVELLNMIKLRS